MVDMTNILKCRQIHDDSLKKSDETHAEYHKRIKDEFLYNVFNNEYKFRGKLIKFKKYVNQNKEVECFYHITTEDNGKGGRRLSIDRYESCLLVFLILDECVCDKVSCQCITIKADYNNAEKISIYCSKYNYVIILKPRKNSVDFITAFPLNGNGESKYL